jgi:DNA-binding NtrC family response regulator
MARGRKEELLGTRVLIADDDEEMRAWLHLVLGDAGASVHEADSGVTMLAALTRLPFDLVISDVRMSWTTGLHALSMARSAGYRMPFLLITAYGNERLREEASRLGAELLEKPLEEEMLLASVRRLLHRPEERVSQLRP